MNKKRKTKKKSQTAGKISNCQKYNKQPENCYHCWTNLDTENISHPWICLNTKSPPPENYHLSNQNLQSNYDDGPYESMGVCNTWCSKTSSNKNHRNTNTSNLYHNYGISDINPEFILNPYHYKDAVTLIQLFSSSKNKHLTRKELQLYHTAKITIMNSSYHICQDNIDITQVDWDDLEDDIEVIDREYMYEIFHDLPQSICSPLVEEKIPLIEDRITLWSDYLLSLNNDNITKIIEIIILQPERFNEIITDFLTYIETKQ